MAGRSLVRMSEIARVAARHGFGYAFERGGPFRSRGREAQTVRGTRGQRLRSMLDELGPSFVKFGQMLSTRPDIVPPDVLIELEKLQDHAQPFAFEEVERLVTDELGAPLDQLFSSFARVPMAAASIGQAHEAVLPDGSRVAVKVQRPNAADQVEADVALFGELAAVVKDNVRRLDFLDAEAVVDEFARAMRAELDYRAEGRNAELLHASFAGDQSVLIPAVHWSHTSERVLTLDFVDGTPIKQLPAETPPEERRRIAYALAELWMEMIFRHGYFHGDPHPANVLVLPDGRIGLVDFGVVGRLSKPDITHLTMLFVDAVLGHVEMLPRRLAELGVRYPRAQEEALRGELEELWHRYHGRSLAEVDPRELLVDSLGVIYRQRLRLPSRFLVLDRAVITLGSVGQSLYPPFNVFEIARPYAEELARSQVTPEALVRRARISLGGAAEAVLGLPHELRTVLERVDHGEIEVGVRPEGLDAPLRWVDRTVNRLILALIVAALLMASAIIAMVPRGPHVLGLQLAALIGLVAAGFVGVPLVLAILRRGRF